VRNSQERSVVCTVKCVGANHYATLKTHPKKHGLWIY